MRRVFRRLVSRAKRQEGAYTLEFLGSLVLTLVMITLVVQVVLVLITSIIFNNALQAAGQEASIQGGPSEQVLYTWSKSLPDNVCGSPAGPSGLNCSNAYLDVKSQGASISPVKKIRKGREVTNFGDVITVDATYNMPTPLLGWFGRDSITFNRVAYFSSQSAKEK